MSNLWVIARIIGLILTIMVYFQIGPEWIWSEDTGGLILYDLILTLFTMFLFAGFLLPFFNRLWTFRICRSTFNSYYEAAFPIAR